MEVAAPEAPDESSNQSSQVKSEDGSALQDGGRSSPPPNCAICLGRCHNKSFTDSCLHQFCFKCLLTWSRVKTECPLCKQVFKSIIHNVKSNHQYEEYPVDQPGNVSGINDVSERLYHAARRFRYRTTLTLQGNQTLDAIQQLLLHYPMTVMDNRERRRPERRTSADFRRTVYRHNLWARPLPDFTGRFRDCTPEFFRFNDSQIHRLVPWLSRELYYLLNENAGHIAYVLERIVEMLPQHAINSREFRAALFCYFGERTEHFLHEFHCFASTPYDITGYDRHVQYGTDARVAQVLSGSDSDSRDSDIVMVSSSHPAPAAPAPGPSRAPAPAAVVPIETISHTDSDSSEVMVVGYIKPPHQRTPELVDLVNSDSDVVMQEPSEAPLVRLTLSRARPPASPARSDSGEEASRTPPRMPRRRLRPRLSPPPLSSSSSSCGTATPPFSSDDEDSREDSPESSSSADGRRHRHRRRRPRQRRERTRRMTKKRSRRQNERERNRSSDRSRSVTVDPPLVTASRVVSSPEPDRDPAPEPRPGREPRPTAEVEPSVDAAAASAAAPVAHRDVPNRSGSKRRAADEADLPRSSRESKRLKSVVMRPTDSSPDSSRSLANTITNSSSRNKRQPVDDIRGVEGSRNSVAKRTADRSGTSRNDERSTNSRTNERSTNSRTDERSTNSRTDERSTNSRTDERSTNSRTDERSVTSRTDERSVTSQIDERNAHIRSDERSVTSRSDERSVTSRSDERSATRRTDERSGTSRDDYRRVRDDRSRSGDKNRSDRRNRSDVRSAKDDVSHSAVKSVRGDRNSGDTTRSNDRSRNGHKSIRDEVNRGDVRSVRGDRSRGDARSVGENRSHSGNSNPSVDRTCNVVRDVHDDRTQRSDTNCGDGRSSNGVTSASDVRNVNTILNGNGNSTQGVNCSGSDSSSSFDENIPLNLAIAKYFTFQRRQENASK